MNESKNFDYYNFRINIVTEVITKEIKFYEEHPYAGVMPLTKYIFYLNSRITGNKCTPAPMIHSDRSGNIHIVKNMNIAEYIKDLDKVTFDNPWNKLKEFHKIMKIKIFIDELEYDPKLSEELVKANREYLKVEICAGLKTKRFIKNKCEIIYDRPNTRIVSISCLLQNKKSKLYEIDWTA